MYTEREFSKKMHWVFHFFSHSCQTKFELIHLCKNVKSNFTLTVLWIRTSQQSITANLRPLTTHIYHVMIIVTDEFSMKSLLLFLRNSFKQFWTYLLQNSQNKFVFFLSIHFFTCCFVIILCINTFHLFVLFTACKDTGWVCSLFAHCFTITVYINTLHLLYFLHHKWYERKPKALIWPAIYFVMKLNKYLNMKNLFV